MNLQMSREEFVELLKGGVIHITFTKDDGSVREMNATLLPEYLPHRGPQLLQETNVTNNNVVKVWDTDIEGWRSVRLDRISKLSLGSW